MMMERAPPSRLLFWGSVWWWNERWFSSAYARACVNWRRARSRSTLQNYSFSRSLFLRGGFPWKIDSKREKVDHLWFRRSFEGPKITFFPTILREQQWEKGWPEVLILCSIRASFFRVRSIKIFFIFFSQENEQSENFFLQIENQWKTIWSVCVCVRAPKGGRTWKSCR